ncbi:RNA 2',3'-cyclic phosphodiesterase [Pengzhenrongella frigida]|uniref:RNA 2',3'-cyclic phosphodiesterase n=1 Tax=Pengzhenrongella frigida TaxID=1259133 RepID=A0A4Q5N6F9_9MICO|nr:RNA 2',3'-cyclic phosphodiesterase [Cellulomonas sp. HLT2-17]RYV52517.1 RNA 2',3'-cyclic phosphodiesterase [Cellulomonas sp. HLT2-17]
MRLFVAVVPPPLVREHLELALSSVRLVPEAVDVRGPLRWAPPEDRHLTLAFYGEVSAGIAEDLAGGLAVIARESAPFDLRLRGAGMFDRRIVWIGCGGEVDTLAELTGRCVDLGRDLTGRDDHRVRSRSHLTVARVRGQSRGHGRHRDVGPGEVSALVHALAVYEGPTWRVEQIVLVSSRPGEGRAGGPAYDPVDVYPLRG